MVSSPWGPLTVRDAHVHFFSHKFFTLLAAQKPSLRAEDLPGLLGWDLPSSEDPAVLADRWVEELDRYLVDTAALIASLPPDVSSVSAAVQRHPHRFHGFAMFDPMHQDAAAVLGANPGIQALCLFPALHRYSLHEPRVLDAIRACARKTAVFVHCGSLSIGVRKKLGLPNLYDPRFSNPLDLEFLAHTCPDVRFIIPHFGSGMFREALTVAAQCPNIYLDTSSTNSWMKIEGLDLRGVLHRAYDVLGPRRLVFGTDSSFFPRGWNKAIFDAQSTAWYELGIRKEEADLIFSANLAHILDFS
jgi:predicted TIM-barrel fold metal-dependent hydrolase